MSPDTLTEEINIYNGVDNSIIFRRVYTKTFKVKINNPAYKNTFIYVWILSEKYILSYLVSLEFLHAINFFYFHFHFSKRKFFKYIKG